MSGASLTGSVRSVSQEGEPLLPEPVVRAARDESVRFVAAAILVVLVGGGLSIGLWKVSQEAGIGSAAVSGAVLFALGIATCRRPTPEARLELKRKTEPQRQHPGPHINEDAPKPITQPQVSPLSQRPHIIQQSEPSLSSVMQPSQVDPSATVVEPRTQVDTVPRVVPLPHALIQPSISIAPVVELPGSSSALAPSLSAPLPPASQQQQQDLPESLEVLMSVQSVEIPRSETDASLGVVKRLVCTKRHPGVAALMDRWGKGSPSVKNHINREYVARPTEASVLKRLRVEGLAARTQQEEEQDDPGFVAAAANLPKAFAFRGAAGPANAQGFVPREFDIPVGSKATVLVTAWSHPQNANVGIVETIGHRRAMEDASLVTQFAMHAAGQQIVVELTAVFDGHGGAVCAQYMRDHIVEHLKGRLETYNKHAITLAGMTNAITHGCVDANAAFAKAHEGNTSGTCANIVLQVGRRLFVGNLGDSRAMVIEPNEEAVQLSTDQDCTGRFAKVIHNRGGFVLHKRVMGDLAVPRALGDLHFLGLVSARAIVTEYTLPEGNAGRNYFLFQGCDGVFDVASTRQVAALTKAQLNAGSTPVQAAMTVTRAALANRTEDNLTVIVKKIVV